MLYKEMLENLEGCPFCEGKKNEVLLDGSHSFLTYALAPYHPHHLLVIPKRHVESLTELTDEEEGEIANLEQKGIRALQKLGYESASLLVREGNAKNKSVCHIHFHLIPEIAIGDVNSKGEERKVMTEEEVEKIVREVKRVL
jgi:diadenosine tetraphosphate (Ap4A) HIT family hydrolase